MTIPMLQQLDVQSKFNKTFCYYWSYPASNADMGAAHSVELLFVFNLRGLGTTSPFNEAVLPLIGYYQFMDKYFTPKYLLGVVAEREQKS